MPPPTTATSNATGGAYERHVRSEASRAGCVRQARRRRAAREGYARRVDALATLSPRTRDWFERAFGAPTPAQELAWPAIAGGRHVLVQAPTGSGKTLAAFLLGLDRLNDDARRGACGSSTSRRSRRSTTTSSGTSAGRSRGSARRSRSGVRTGDTPQRDRERMLRTPPDILITTPESLYLLLTSRGRDLLKTVETVILDEVHAVAGTKRGAHLSLSLERLERVADAAVPADRPVGDAAPARRDRPLGGRARPRDRARRRRAAQGARPGGRRPGRGHARARGLVAAAVAAGRAGRRRDGLGLRGDRPLDLALDLPGAARARPRAPLDDRVRQQPPPRRAARTADQRARRGRRSRAPTTARSRASSGC